MLNFILPLAEKLHGEYGKLVWIFAGYVKEMEKLFEHNQGLPSRFPQHFVFDDYTDAELELIFRGFMDFEEKVVVEAPKPSAAPATSAAPSAAPASSSRPPQPTRARPARSAFVAPIYGYNSYGLSNMPGAQITDRHGQVWTNNGAQWLDKYQNAVVDPHRAGEAGTPVYDTQAREWTFDDARNMWMCNDGSEQSHYPGSPAPPKPAPAPATATSSATKRVRRTPPFRCDAQDLQTAMRRLGRRRGARGFGNARTVRSFFDQVLQRQGKRLTEERRAGNQPDLHYLSKSDLLGSSVSLTELEKIKEWQELQKMEGLQEVKDSVMALMKLVVNNQQREDKGQAPLDVVLNRLFLGNPGTGKTTVATLYAKILRALGMLSKGDVVMKTASDFLGDVLGSSEKKTRDILAAAEGCVLVIDEAYGLCPGKGTSDPYRTAVLDTIVEQVQARAGDDRAVVMLGYRKEMEHMLKVANPGLARRFQLDNAFNFADYNDAQLLRILLAKVKGQGLAISTTVARRAIRSLAKVRAKPNFGNAGAVATMLSEAVQRMQRRPQQGTTMELSLADFGLSERDGPDKESLDQLFSDLLGCENVEHKMNELLATVEFARQQGHSAADKVAYNWVFTGSPGTGKTTVARRMGKMFYHLGLLPTDEFKELSASDMVTGYAGQAGQLTRSRLEDVSFRRGQTESGFLKYLSILTLFSCLGPWRRAVH